MGLKRFWCRVCKKELYKVRQGGRNPTLCRPPATCKAKYAVLRAQERRRMGIEAIPRSDRPRQETVAQQRYREALAFLAKAKEDVEAKRRAVETAEGVVEQAEVRVRDAQAAAHRESALEGEA